MIGETLSVQTLECLDDCATLCSFFFLHIRGDKKYRGPITGGQEEQSSLAVQQLSVAMALALSDLLYLERQPNE